MDPKSLKIFKKSRKIFKNFQKSSQNFIFSTQKRKKINYLLAQIEKNILIHAKKIFYSRQQAKNYFRAS